METNFSFNMSHGVFEQKMICLEIASPSKYISIFVASLSVLTICGNFLVITSIIYFKQLHTPTNFLILSLAVTDLLVGFLLLPYSLLPVTGEFCVVIFYFDLYLCSCSVWILCFISVERYYAVCQPLRYRTKMNVCVTVTMIILSWLLALLTLWSTGVFQEIFNFYLPAIIMCAMYLKIFIVARRQAHSIQNTTCQSTKSDSKMEKKATKTLAIVVGVFLLCWSSFYIGIHLISDYPTFYAYGICKCIGWLNSMLNPFIYGVFYSWFRSAFRMIISGKIFQGDFTHSKLS